MELNIEELQSMNASEPPLKSALKDPAAHKENPNIKKKITYDTILEKMGLYVSNEQLYELSKHFEPEEETKTYPIVNKKPKNIPQNGYIYSKFNKHVLNNKNTQQPPNTIPRPNTIPIPNTIPRPNTIPIPNTIPRPNTIPTQKNIQTPISKTNPPTMAESRDTMIRRLIHNHLIKKQAKTQKKTLVIM